jgi:hypothetical protein
VDVRAPHVLNLRNDFAWQVNREVNGTGKTKQTKSKNKKQNISFSVIVPSLRPFATMLA